jgi:hypothetical protein
MRRKWGPKSLAVRETLDPRLQRWVDRVLQEVCDISLLYGYRGEAEQNELFDNNLSKLRFPDSKHNRQPSQAVDLQPYPRPLHDSKLWGALGYIAGRGEAIAEDMGITLRWGGDWDRDGDLTDQNFDDLFHWEIVEDDST